MPPNPDTPCPFVAARRRVYTGSVKEPLVLGIESTCDETGIGLVRGSELLVDRTATSMDQYARYGGIIPEIASRAHLESFLPTLDAALDEAGVSLDAIDAIAVAAGPGLVGSLTVGICAAKALASTVGKPLYGVNHVIGHLAVDALADGKLPEKFIGLIISGGHSNILLVRDIAPTSSNSAAPSTMPRGRPSIRSGAFSTCPTRAARMSTASRSRAIPQRSDSPVAWERGRIRSATSTTSPSPDSRPRSPAISKGPRNGGRRSLPRTCARASPRR